MLVLKNLSLYLEIIDQTQILNVHLIVELLPTSQKQKYEFHDTSPFKKLKKKNIAVVRILFNFKIKNKFFLNFKVVNESSEATKQGSKFTSKHTINKLCITYQTRYCGNVNAVFKILI